MINSGEHTWTKRRFKAIFFDFDGVLAESVATKDQAFRTIYQPYGQDVIEKVLAHHRRYAGISRVEKIKYCHQEFLDIALDDPALEVLTQQFSNLVEDGVIQCETVVGAVEFLDREKPRRDLFVISGTPEDELRRITTARNLNDYFKGIYGSPRYKEEIIKTLLKQYRYHPDDVLFIGDGLTDYEAAMACGLPFAGRVAPNDVSPFPAGTAIYPDLMAMHKDLETNYSAS